jgi:hypothetical protein
MSIRSLHRRLGRVAAHSGLRRCPCGVYLPPDLCKPSPLRITEGYSVPSDLAALLPLATTEEARELHELLNATLERCPDLAQRRGTSHQIWGGEPAESDLLRFRFAAQEPAGPCCPACGRPVFRDQAITCLKVMTPAPEGLLEALRLDPWAATRYAGITMLLRQRAGVADADTSGPETGDDPGRGPSANHGRTA